MKWEFICPMNFYSSIQNIIYKNLHYCRTRWTQNNKNLYIEYIVNLVHILRLFPHHPRGKSHCCNVFLAVTAVQEAHLSICVCVCLSVPKLSCHFAVVTCNVACRVKALYKGCLDNFLFSRSNFFRRTENGMVIQNIFQMFSWAP